jgi:hypothetical protein
VNAFVRRSDWPSDAERNVVLPTPANTRKPWRVTNSHTIVVLTIFAKSKASTNQPTNYIHHEVSSRSHRASCHVPTPVVIRRSMGRSGAGWGCHWTTPTRPGSCSGTPALVTIYLGMWVGGLVTKLAGGSLPSCSRDHLQRRMSGLVLASVESLLGPA